MRFIRILPLLLVVLAIGSSPAAAQAKKACAPFPHVAWWGDMTHDTVRKVVRDRHVGDWRPVIDSLSQQMSVLQMLKDQGRPYAVPNSTRQLGGDQLVVYLDQVRLTLSILYCLRDQDMARGNGADKPTTAAPTPAPSKASERS